MSRAQGALPRQRRGPERWRRRRSSCTAPRSRSGASSPERCAARRSGARASASRAPARTWRTSRRAPSARGDDWIVNGHKVWTSLGHFAQWMILLARTSREHKYDGLTYFLCPIAGHPGVTVRPLVKITGDERLQRGAVRERRDPRLAAPRRGGQGLDGRDDDAHLRARRGRERRRRAAAIDAQRDRAPRRARAAHRRATARAPRDDPLTRDAIVQQAIVARGHAPERAALARPGALRPPAAASAPDEAARHRVRAGKRAARRRDRRRGLDALQARPGGARRRRTGRSRI